MTEKKMTESEIMKALELCANDGDCKECAINPHKGNYGYCTSLAIKTAIDLINRKNAEIDELQHEKTELQYKIEKLNFENLQMVASIKGLKAEAIKEFVERVKQEDDEGNHIFDDCASILVPKEYRRGREEKTNEFWETIYKIAKEMGCGE